MKKIAKSIYLVCLAVITVLVFTFSITGISDSKDNYKKTAAFDTETAFSHIEHIASASHPRGSAAHDSARQYIVGKLTEYGANPVEMHYSCTYEDVVSMGGYGGSYTLVPETPVKNILVKFPGTKTQDVLMIQAHYDSVPMGFGAYDDSVPVSAMLECIRQIKLKETKFNNTVVFLFTDGEEEGLLGARMFAGKRPTTNGAPQEYTDLMDNVKFLTNWEARGTGGKLIMFETTKDNYETVANFAKINRYAYTNSVANFIYSQMPNGTDYSAFSVKGVQGLNFANIGEGTNYHTQFDDLAHVDKSNIAANGAAMQSCIKHFSSIDLNLLYESDSNAVFFSWMNIFTAVYSKTAAYVFAVLIILGYGVAAFFNFRNKKYSFKEFFKALAVNIIALIGAVITVFIIKSVFALIPAFAVVLNSPSYAHLAITLAYLFFAAGMYALIIYLFNRILKVSDADLNMHANGLFISILACAVTFILAEISFVFTIPALFSVAIALCSVLIKRFDLSKLYLGFVPCLVMLPTGISLMILAADALGMSLAVFTIIPTIMALGYVLPYICNMQGYLAQKTKTIQTENASAGNRAAVYTARKSSYLAVALSTLVALIFLFVGLSAPIGISANTIGKASGRTLLFIDDTIIYDTEIGSSGGGFIIYDEDCHRYLFNNYKIDTEYSSVIGGYLLNLNGTVSTASPTIATAYNAAGYYTINIAKAYADSAFSLYFPLTDGSTNITMIEVTDANGTYTFTTAEFISKMTAKGEIKFRSWSDSEVKVYVSSQNLSFRYVENADLDINGIAEIDSLLSKEAYLKTGVQLHKSYSLT